MIMRYSPEEPLSSSPAPCLCTHCQLNRSRQEHVVCCWLCYGFAICSKTWMCAVLCQQGYHDVSVMSTCGSWTGVIPKDVDCCHALCRCSAFQETPCLMTSLSWPWLGKGQGLGLPRMSSSSQQVDWTCETATFGSKQCPTDWRTFHDQNRIYDPVALNLKQGFAGMHSSVTVFLTVVIRTVMTYLRLQGQNSSSKSRFDPSKTWWGW